MNDCFDLLSMNTAVNRRRGRKQEYVVLIIVFTVCRAMCSVSVSCVSVPGFRSRTPSPTRGRLRTRIVDVQPEQQLNILLNIVYQITDSRVFVVELMVK